MGIPEAIFVWAAAVAQKNWRETEAPCGFGKNGHDCEPVANRGCAEAQTIRHAFSAPHLDEHHGYGAISCVSVNLTLCADGEAVWSFRQAIFSEKNAYSELQDTTLGTISRVTTPETA